MVKFISIPKAEIIKNTLEIDETIKEILKKSHLLMYKIFDNYKKIHNSIQNIKSLNSPEAKKPEKIKSFYDSVRLLAHYGKVIEVIKH